jgi:hypothetical protein
VQRLELTREGEAVAVGEVVVEDGDRRLVEGGMVEGLLGGRRGRDVADPGLVAEQRHQAGTDGRVVVDDQHVEVANRGGGHGGQHGRQERS